MLHGMGQNHGPAPGTSPRSHSLPPDATYSQLGIMSRSASRRLGQIAAYLAAPLWALQAPIWMAAPKVQAQTVPYRITNPVLFELFWLSIAGAVAFSAAAARPITRHVGARFAAVADVRRRSCPRLGSGHRRHRV